MVSARAFRGASFLGVLAACASLPCTTAASATLTTDSIDRDDGDTVDVVDVAVDADDVIVQPQIEGDELLPPPDGLVLDDVEPSTSVQSSDEESKDLQGASEADFGAAAAPTEGGDSNINDGGSGGDDIADKQQQQEIQYSPPTHFQITAHIQTNLHTGYSYFLPKESLPASFAHLPFLECGAVGSTTESLPLVSGVFRHVPHTVAPKRDEATMGVVLENLEEADVEETNEEGGSKVDVLEGDDIDNETNESAGASSEGAGDEYHPKRPSPPKYVVALTEMEVTVGGSGNETQKFKAGDVIFIEDSWWGVWDDFDEEDSRPVESDNEQSTGNMKGYVMRASSGSQEDLQVLMLTVPNPIHRHWKNVQYAMVKAKQQRRQHRQSSAHAEFGTRRSWWKPATFLPKGNGNDDGPNLVPQPCSLESDPAFAHPRAMSSMTLSQHFTQHFTSLLRRSSNPHPSFLPQHHQDLILPVLAQTVAAAVGGATALALVLQLWRVIPGPIAVGFGSACLVALGTWGFVWLGEEILDQLELWRERRRLVKMMSEGWGGGWGTTGRESP